nr:FecR domain-containing protein [Cerasicoccus arenae]
MRFKQGVTINTASDATVVLLFSNGSSLTIKPDTTLSIEEYLQAPLPQDAPTLDSLDKEPTTSKTKLRLLEGDIIGSVKKLNTEEGSSYQVDSPIGTAGIRGTNYEFSTNIRGIATPSGRFGIAIGNGIYIPLSNKEEVVGALEELNFTGVLNGDGSITITSIQAQGMSEAQATSINISASQAQALFAEFSNDDFNPDAPGAKGGEFSVKVTPTTPAPRVTPEQGVNNNTGQ